MHSLFRTRVSHDPEGDASWYACTTSFQTETRQKRQIKEDKMYEKELSSRFCKLWPITKLDSRQWCIVSCRWPVFHGCFLFFLFLFSSSSSSSTSSSSTASSHFCFPTSLVECVASALTHCQKERRLSQWLACVHEEEEEDEEATATAAAVAAAYEGEAEEDGDEEETITIEGVCPPGRRRCFPILFRRCFFGPPLLCPRSTLLIFLPTFRPFVSDQGSW